MQKLIIGIAFLLGANCQLGAQNNTPGYLLWFNGKVIKPNTLLKANGDTVFYNPVKKEVRVSTKRGAENKFDRMLQELRKTEQRSKEMLSRFSKNSPLEAMPLIQKQIQSAYTSVQNDVQPILQQNWHLPDTGIALPANPAVKGGAYNDMAEQVMDRFEDAYRSFAAYREKHQGDDLTILPVPPVYNYSYCMPCDSLANQSYQQQKKQFESDLMGPDLDMYNYTLGIARQAALLISGEEGKRASDESGKMLRFLFDRLHKKTNYLLEKYIDDGDRVMAVIDLAMWVERYGVLFWGTGIEMDYLGRGHQTAMRKLLKAVDEKDYAVGLNMQLFLQIERRLQLLNMATPAAEVNKFFDFNQFKLGMNITAKLGKEDAYNMAHVRGDNWFVALPGDDCRLKWVMVAPRPLMMKFDLIAAEYRGPGVDIPYVGTKDWEASTPSMRIDFCKADPEIKDSLVAYPFNAKNGDEFWVFPPPTGTIRGAFASGALLSCFIDKERMEEEARQMNQEKMEKIKRDMQANIDKLKGIAGNTTGNPDAGTISASGDLGGLAAIQQAARQATEMIYDIHPGRYIFEPQVNNRQTMIIKERLNGQEIFPDNPAIVYAWFHLTLEHDPMGPRKIRW